MDISIIKEFKTVYEQLADIKKQLDDYICMKDESQTEKNVNQDADIGDAQEAIAETYDAVDANSTDITDVQEAIAEIYELITGGEA